MRVVNTSSLPDAGVRWLVRWAAREMEVADYVRLVEVKDTSKLLLGRCWGRRVLCRVGPDSQFPRAERQYRKTAPKYAIADRWECLVALLGHEFCHSRTFRWNADDRAQRRQHSEVECERLAYWLLGRFRMSGLRAELDRLMADALAREEAVRAAALRAPAELRSEAMEALDVKIARWERKLKTAETYLKKYRRQRRRLERAITKTAGEEPATRGGQP